MKISIKQSFNPWILQAGYFRRNVFIFQTTFVKIINYIFLFFFYGLLWFQINSLCILFSWVIVELGKTVTEAKCIILEIANILKIGIFPSTLALIAGSTHVKPGF